MSKRKQKKISAIHKGSEAKRNDQSLTDNPYNDLELKFAWKTGFKTSPKAIKKDPLVIKINFPTRSKTQKNKDRRERKRLAV